MLLKNQSETTVCHSKDISSPQYNFHSPNTRNTMDPNFASTFMNGHEVPMYGHYGPSSLPIHTMDGNQPITQANLHDDGYESPGTFSSDVTSSTSGNLNISESNYFSENRNDELSDYHVQMDISPSNRVVALPEYPQTLPASNRKLLVQETTKDYSRNDHKVNSLKTNFGYVYTHKVPSFKQMNSQLKRGLAEQKDKTQPATNKDYHQDVEEMRDSDLQDKIKTIVIDADEYSESKHINNQKASDVHTKNDYGRFQFIGEDGHIQQNSVGEHKQVGIVRGIPKVNSPYKFTNSSEAAEQEKCLNELHCNNMGNGTQKETSAELANEYSCHLSLSCPNTTESQFYDATVQFAGIAVHNNKHNSSKYQMINNITARKGNNTPVPQNDTQSIDLRQTTVAKVQQHDLLPSAAYNSHSECDKHIYTTCSMSSAASNCTNIQENDVNNIAHSLSSEVAPILYHQQQLRHSAKWDNARPSSATNSISGSYTVYSPLKLNDIPDNDHLTVANKTGTYSHSVTPTNSLISKQDSFENSPNSTASSKRVRFKLDLHGNTHHVTHYFNKDTHSPMDCPASLHLLPTSSVAYPNLVTVNNTSTEKHQQFTDNNNTSQINNSSVKTMTDNSLNSLQPARAQLVISHNLPVWQSNYSYSGRHNSGENTTYYSTVMQNKKGSSFHVEYNHSAINTGSNISQSRLSNLNMKVLNDDETELESSSLVADYGCVSNGHKHNSKKSSHSKQNSLDSLKSLKSSTSDSNITEWLNCQSNTHRYNSLLMRGSENRSMESLLNTERMTGQGDHNKSSSSCVSVMSTGQRLQQLRQAKGPVYASTSEIYQLLAANTGNPLALRSPYYKHFAESSL